MRNEKLVVRIEVNASIWPDLYDYLVSLPPGKVRAANMLISLDRDRLNRIAGFYGNRRVTLPEQNEFFIKETVAPIIETSNEIFSRPFDMSLWELDSSESTD